MNIKTIAFLLFSIFMIQYANNNTLPKKEIAKPGQTSVFNNYENISGLKHDFFKLFIMTFVPAMLASNPIVLFDINNFDNSAIGKAIIVSLTIAFYHTTVQPLVNYLPKF